MSGIGRPSLADRASPGGDESSGGDDLVATAALGHLEPDVGDLEQRLARRDVDQPWLAPVESAIPTPICTTEATARTITKAGLRVL